MTVHDTTITVGMPTLDRYPYVATLLDDLAVQTHLPDEVLIVDQTAPQNRQPIPAGQMEPRVSGACAGPGNARHHEGQEPAPPGMYVPTSSLNLTMTARIDPDYVENHIRHFADDRVDVVSGPVYEWDADDPRVVRQVDQPSHDRGLGRARICQRPYVQRGQ